MGVAAWIWLGLALAFGVAEGVTTALVSAWFAGGAAAAFIAALLGVGPVWQIVLFALVSAALLACLRPLAKKRAVVHTVATNADRILRREAVVVEEIDNLRATGAVRIDGLVWTARSRGEGTIPAGETVRILEISGVKVIVEPAMVLAGQRKG